MLKRIFTALLALLMLSGSLMNLGLLVYYQLNKTYIANQWCVNKDRPALKCEGKCYLGKQLKKAEEGQQKALQKWLQEKEIFLESDHTKLPRNPLVELRELYPTLQEFPLPAMDRVVLGLPPEYRA